MMKYFFFATLFSITILTSCITINQNPDTESRSSYEEDELFIDYSNADGSEEFEFDQESNFKAELGFEEEPSFDGSDFLGKKANKDDHKEHTTRRIKTHEFRDARTGLVVQSTEYPASWTVISRPSYTVDQKLPVFMIQTSGPNNLKSFNTPMKVNISYRNPKTYQFMQGSRVADLHRPIVNNHQILNEEVRPRMQKCGFTYVKDIRLTKSENFIKEKIRTEGQGQVQVDFLGTVWKNKQGQKALVGVAKIYMQQPLSFMDTMTLWMYNIDYVFVDADHFDKTIDAFENALINTKENPQWKQYLAQLKKQRHQQAIRDHQIHMENKQIAFNAHQKKMQGIWAAQDANYASFMNRHLGSGNDRIHQNFVNMINEEETVYNPVDGKSYQVNAFSEQNWMDSNGNLVQNNDLFYTPNGDINLNNREWVQVSAQN